MSTHTARLADLLERWRDDPVSFVREAFDAEPDPWQAAFMRAVACHDRVAARSAHGVGKTTAVAWLILWFAHTRRPFKIPVTGSNFDQLKATTWAELGMWLRRMPKPFQKAWDYTTEGMKLVDAPEECFVALRTAAKDKAQNLAGFHSDNVLVIVDEASAVDDAIYEVLEGALTGDNAKIVLTGNPTIATGKFHRAFNEERGLYSTFHVSAFDTDRVKQRWIDQQVSAYGLDSNFYRVRVLGEFPTSSADGVIPLELIEAAVDRDVQRLHHVRPIWGVDVGGKPIHGDEAGEIRNDASALAKRQANHLIEPVKSWLGKDPTELSGLIMREWLDASVDTRPAEIVVDVIGIGAGVASNLEAEGLPIRKCNVAESASGSECARLRDELWWKARKWFSELDCVIPHDQALIGELSVPRYGTTPAGKIKVEGKDELAKRKVRSPNLADAFIMTFAGNERSTRYAQSTRRQVGRNQQQWDVRDGW